MHHSYFQNNTFDDKFADMCKKISNYVFAYNTQPFHIHLFGPHMFKLTNADKGKDLQWISIDTFNLVCPTNCLKLSLKQI